jgi:hypothetical protein
VEEHLGRVEHLGDVEGEALRVLGSDHGARFPKKVMAIRMGLLLAADRVGGCVRTRSLVGSADHRLDCLCPFRR